MVVKEDASSISHEIARKEKEAEREEPPPTDQGVVERKKTLFFAKMCASI
jgi:hypothetical protein